MKKPFEVDNDLLITKRNRELRNKYTSPVIKWYEATMTKQEKYKLGMMSYEEFVQWQQELATEKAAEELIKDHNDETSYRTFWEADEGDRENISAHAYEDFLAQNNINVSNSTAIDMDSLLNNDN